MNDHMGRSVSTYKRCPSPLLSISWGCIVYKTFKGHWQQNKAQQISLSCPLFDPQPRGKWSCADLQQQGLRPVEHPGCAGSLSGHSAHSCCAADPHRQESTSTALCSPETRLQQGLFRLRAVFTASMARSTSVLSGAVDKAIAQS